MSSCKSKPIVDVNSVDFPLIPLPCDKEGNPYVKAQNGYCYMPEFYWESILEYMAATEDAIEELQGY